MPQIWESISGGFVWPDPGLQHTFCLCHRLCRPCFLCGNRGAETDKGAVSDGQAVGHDSWLFSGWSCILLLLRYGRPDAVCSGGIKHQHGYCHIWSAGGDLYDGT